MPKGNEISIQKRQLQTSQNMELPGWRPNLQVSVLLASLTSISSITCKISSTVVTWLPLCGASSLIHLQVLYFLPFFKIRKCTGCQHTAPWLLPPASSPVPTSHSPPLHTSAQEVLFLVTGGKKWSDLAPSMGCPHPQWHLWLISPSTDGRNDDDSIISVS